MLKVIESIGNRNITYSWVERTHIKMTIIPKGWYRLNAIPITISMALFKVKEEILLKYV